MDLCTISRLMHARRYVASSKTILLDDKEITVTSDDPLDIKIIVVPERRYSMRYRVNPMTISMVMV